MGARLFWLISRTAIFLYRRFPVFGRIHGSVGIIRRNGSFLVIERNDGYGLSLPGGVVHPFEDAETALRREVREETGLEVTSAEQKLVFQNSILYPSRTTVFEATAEGKLRSSWEGRAVLVTLEELERGIIPTQTPVIEYLKRHVSRVPD